MSSSRREFMMVVAALLGAPAVLSACGGDSGTDGGSGSDSGGGSCSSTTVTIAMNHGHVLVVTGGDVRADVAKNYDITGSATHSHNVTITAAQFTSLAGGSPLMVTSSLAAGHTHAITIDCV